MNALIVNGKVWQLGVEPSLAGLMTVVDASGVDGIAVGWSYDGHSFSPPPAAAPTVGDLTAYAASARYRHETGGFAFRGHAIATDEASQAKIGNAALGATVVGAGFSTDWKCSDGSFVTLDQSTMMAMATAVLLFVSACYGAEAALKAEITGRTVTTFAQVDGHAWPAASSS